MAHYLLRQLGSTSDRGGWSGCVRGPAVSKRDCGSIASPERVTRSQQSACGPLGTVSLHAVGACAEPAGEREGGRR